MKVLRILFILVGIMGITTTSAMLVDIWHGRVQHLRMSPHFHANVDAGAMTILIMLFCMSVYMVAITIYITKTDK